jgi:DNA-binding transcriptional MerR regulator/methylmalonyl-CoA mutase cobalamin-binding subunit
VEDRSAQFRIGQLAARTGVGPERLRKWEARYGLLAPDRSNGGFRIYSPEDEQRVRLMQRHLARGYAAAEAADLARQGIVAPAPAKLASNLPEAVVERAHLLMRRALDEYDEGAAQRALDDLFKAFAIDAVVRDAVLPFLREVGNAWEGGQLSLGQEHFASTIIEGRLMSLARGWGSGTGPRALLACPQGERHTFGLVAFGIALSRRGWRVTYLGADTPADSIAAAARKVATALVILSSVKSRCFNGHAEELAAIATEHQVVIAGAGATKAAAERVGAQRVTSDPVSAAARIAASTRDASRRGRIRRRSPGRG